MATTNAVPFYLRRFQSLLGIIPVGVFVLFHGFVNSLAFYHGAEKWDEAVAMIHDMPYLMVLRIGGIAVPILLHAILGFYIWIYCQRNVEHYGYTRNWLYTLQRWTGVFAFFFICFHVYELAIQWHFTTEMEKIESWYVADYFKNVPIIIFYFLGITAVVFHFANGIWNFLIKWGFTVGEKSQTISGVVCTIFGLVIYYFFLSSLFFFSTTTIEKSM